MSLHDAKQVQNDNDAFETSLKLFKALIEGASYETVAAQHGLALTAARRHVKALTLRLLETDLVDQDAAQALTLMKEVIGGDAYVNAAARHGLNPALAQRRVRRLAGRLIKVAVDKANAATAIEMLKAVIDGETYLSVARQHGVTEYAVERRIKALVVRMIATVGVDGLSVAGAKFTHRLRRHRADILLALERFDPSKPPKPREVSILADDAIARAALLVKLRSNHPAHDHALFLMLFVTGARALEIARLEIRDYLNHDGSVRRISEVRSEIAVTGKARPICFTNAQLNAALESYLAERREAGLGTWSEDAYGGFEPTSRLFVSQAGEGFPIKEYRSGGPQRFLCRSITELYLKLFRYADLSGVTPLTARRLVAARLYSLGADEGHVGLLFGISDLGSVRQQFPKTEPEPLPRLTLQELAERL